MRDSSCVVPTTLHICLLPLLGGIHVSIASSRKIGRRKICVDWHRGVGENSLAVYERLDLVLVPGVFFIQTMLRQLHDKIINDPSPPATK
jgi:hypothetical protein